MRARGGALTDSASTNSSTRSRSPCTTISTPAEVLHTQPCRRSCVASPYTNGRKPTPCTTPVTWIRFVVCMDLLPVGLHLFDEPIRPLVHAFAGLARNSEGHYTRIQDLHTAFEIIHIEGHIRQEIDLVDDEHLHAAV